MTVLRRVARLSGYGLRRWRALVGVLLTLALQSAVGVAKPWPLKVVVDQVLGGRQAHGWLAGVRRALPGAATAGGLLDWAVAATLVLFVLAWVVEVAGKYANVAFGQSIVYDLAEDLFGHLQRMSLRFHGRRPVGDSIRRVTADSTCASVIVNDALVPALAGLVTVAAMLAVMWGLDPELTLVSVGVVPVVVLAFRRYARPMEERSHTLGRLEGELYGHVEGQLSSMPVVQAFAGEPAADERMRSLAGGVLRAALAELDAQYRFKMLVGLALAAGTAAVFWVGAHHVMSGRLTVGTVVVFTAYLTALYTPLESVMYASSTIQGAMGGARRVLEVLDTDPEVTDAPDARPLPRVRGRVTMEGVGFAYEPGRPVLTGIDLDVAPGQTVAILGRTGAGKSTLVGLVPRFFDPTEGRVLIDGCDLAGARLDTVRANVSVVLQEPFLFPVTVADNIAYGRPGADRSEIEAAARAANAHDFISALADGYDTVVGERGVTLSGGERQRLAIARALVKDAPILILDEPTSALDAATEAALLEALERLKEGRTTLVIAHRLSTVANADHIVVLDHGRVAESGTHAQLMASGGLYRHLQVLQTGGRGAGLGVPGDGAVRPTVVTLP